MHRVICERRVFKDLESIPSLDVERIRECFKGLSVDPFPPGFKKLSGSLGLYRIRQGNYRIIYAVVRQEKEVRVLLVRHRKDSYRKFP